MKKKQSGFTLVELLVTVGIIAILAAILLPVVTQVFKVAEKNKARLQALEIKKAVDAFYSAYNRAPVTFAEIQGKDDTTENEAWNPDTNQTIIKALIGDKDDRDAKKINPRGTVFLAVKAEPDCPDGEDITKGNFYDPWCTTYGIMLDKDGDGKIEYRNQVRITRCIAISAGPNQKQDVGDNNSDNISSED